MFNVRLSRFLPVTFCIITLFCLIVQPNINRSIAQEIPTRTPSPTPTLASCPDGDVYELMVDTTAVSIGDIITVSHGFAAYGGTWSITANDETIANGGWDMDTEWLDTAQLRNVAPNQYEVIGAGDITLQLSGYGEVAFYTPSGTEGDCYQGWVFSSISSPPVTVSNGNTGGLPDLTITSHWLAFDARGCNVIGIQFTVINQGDMAAPPFDIEYVDTGDVQTIAGLDAGDFIVVPFTDGEHYGRLPTVIVDPANVIAESDETNNTFVADWTLPIPTQPVHCMTPLATTPAPTPDCCIPPSPTPTPDCIPTLPTVTPTNFQPTATPDNINPTPTPTAHPDCPTAMPSPTPPPDCFHPTATPDNISPTSTPHPDCTLPPFVPTPDCIPTLPTVTPTNFQPTATPDNINPTPTPTAHPDCPTATPSPTPTPDCFHPTATPDNISPTSTPHPDCISTPPPTPTSTPTPTRFIQTCTPPAYPRLVVEPLPAVTNRLTETITIDLTGYVGMTTDIITVTLESGTFNAYNIGGNAFPIEIPITLLPNEAHNLTVSWHVFDVPSCNGGTHDHVRNIAQDRNGDLLVIVHGSAATNTPVPTGTSSLGTGTNTETDGEGAPLSVGVDTVAVEGETAVPIPLLLFTLATVLLLAGSYLFARKR